MKRILITGGAGFIGSNLVRYIINKTDNEVLNLDKLTYAGNQNSLKDIAKDKRYHFQQVDILDTAKVKETVSSFNPQIIMHLAAESHVDRSIDGPGNFITTNINGTYSMLEAALEHWKTLSDEHRKTFVFHHISTDEVYGSLDFDSGLFTEESPYDPHSPYAASKAASDHLVRAWHDTYGLPVIVTNCSNNYGPFQFPEKLVPVVILKCLAEDAIPVYGKGLNVRDWLYVEDHVDALYRVVTKGESGQTYNIGGNNEMSNLELVTMICKIMDRIRPRKNGASYEQLISFVEDRPGHDLRYAINADKIKNELGWEPMESLSTGMEKTIAWYIENQIWGKQIISGKYRLERLGSI